MGKKQYITIGNIYFALIAITVIAGCILILMPSKLDNPENTELTAANAEQGLIIDKTDPECDYCKREKAPMFEWSVAFKGMKFKRTVCIDCFIKALDLVLGEPEKNQKED